MTKRVFRYFLDFLDSQERWLNKMAAEGYRLKKCGILTYVFESCNPNEYEYAVEIVGHLPYRKALEYKAFLDSIGYRTLTKNLNANYTVGKVTWRPWAKGMGQIATSPGGYNKELLIVEKKRDGKPFELHTDLQDRLSIYRTIRSAYIYALFMMTSLLILTVYQGNATANPFIWLIGILPAIIVAVLTTLTVKYSLTIQKLKEKAKINE